MKYFFFLSLMAIFGCAHTNVSEHEKIVRNKASYDLNCENSELLITQVESQEYLVKCGVKEASFKVKCSLGPCWAKKIK